MSYFMTHVRVSAPFPRCSSPRLTASLTQRSRSNQSLEPALIHPVLNDNALSVSKGVVCLDNKCVRFLIIPPPQNPPPQNVGGLYWIRFVASVRRSVGRSVSNSCPLYNSFTNGRISFKLE